MGIKSAVLCVALAAGVAAVPLAGAKAQYYGPPPCSPFPLTWPFCVAGAAVYTAGAIITAPFRAVAPPPPPPPAYYAPRPAAAPAYYAPAAAPAYYAPGWRYRQWCYNHPYRCHR
jgi:hypothetical protein